MKKTVEIIGAIAYIVLAALAIFCCCPGGDMDQAYAQTDTIWEPIVIYNQGIEVTYYVTKHERKMDTADVVYYCDTRSCWRIGDRGLVLHEKMSKYFPRVIEFRLLHNQQKE